ncbi:MAG TPA: class A beta-lactamase [Verrucomicrobiae bacterium]|nr:class A beta-lactamase [Verrucomicrobiae bacterium]
MGGRNSERGERKSPLSEKKMEGVAGRLTLTRREWLIGAATAIPTMWVRAKERQGASGQAGAEASIAAIEARLGGRMGVAALDTGSGRRIEHRAGERFPMCSTFKFLLVAAILTRVDAHGEKLDRVIRYAKSDLLEYAPVTRGHAEEGGMTISDLCAAAIEYSDNTAANLLLNVLGGPKGVTAYARSLGDGVTRLDRNEPALNSAIPGDKRDTTSPSAMLEDMKKILVEEKALQEDSRKRLEEWMAGNTTGTDLLRAGLPVSWRIGDKTGSGRNGATNDIAICRPPNRPPILVTAYFVESKAPDTERRAAIAEVGRIVGRELA